MEEYTYVLRLMPGVYQDKFTTLLHALNSEAINVVIPDTLKACKDPDDDKFLETAITGHAEYLVTKNIKHYPSKSYRHVRIVKVSKFLREIEKQFPQPQ